ncbi:HTH domain-containing protein [Streptomyces sp. NPDC056656]|uniref:HTH domain-containing protein n=1 Tax=Streptomyces sp. NPDC056656 TaxID=3345895 RepID=UPI00368CA325
MGENQALRDALGVAQRQLVEAEAELREVRERVNNLRSVVYGLKQIFEPGDAGRSFELRPAVEESRAMSVRRTQGVRSRGEPSPSVRRAVQILAEAQRPMRMPEITEEWKSRGWVDPTWRTPKSAINMIYQRAHKAGLVARTPDRSWVLRSSVSEAPEGDHVTGEGVED